MFLRSGCSIASVPLGAPPERHKFRTEQLSQTSSHCQYALSSTFLFPNAIQHRSADGSTKTGRALCTAIMSCCFRTRWLCISERRTVHNHVLATQIAERRISVSISRCCNLPSACNILSRPSTNQSLRGTLLPRSWCYGPDATKLSHWERRSRP